MIKALKIILIVIAIIIAIPLITALFVKKESLLSGKKLKRGLAG